MPVDRLPLAIGVLPPAAGQSVSTKDRCPFGFDYRVPLEKPASPGDTNPRVWQLGRASRVEMSEDGVTDVLCASPGEACSGSCIIEIDGEAGTPAIFVQLSPADAVSSAVTGGASLISDDIVEWRTRAHLSDQLTLPGYFPSSRSPFPPRAERSLIEDGMPACVT